MFRELLYIADPMCSWCYGFAPELAKIRAALPADVALRYVMGGLAPDSDAPMAADVIGYVQNAWRAVEERTGRTFNWEFWDRCAPRRSTYPACRAVIAARKQGQENAMFEALQRAYYQEARNPSDTATARELATELGLDLARFDLDLRDGDRGLAEDLRLCHDLGVDGFPALVERGHDGAQVRMRGFEPAESVLLRLR